jgi:peroxiredoxin
VIGYKIFSRTTIRSNRNAMNKKHITLAIVTLGIGIPLIMFFIQDLKTSEPDASQQTLRELFGDETYEALVRGKKTEEHYLGNTRRAPDFSLRDRFGKEFRLSELRGRLVVLNFWTITCKPCIEELPALERLTNLVAKRKDIAVIAVSVDAGWDAVKRVFPADFSLKLLFDPERRVVTQLYGTRLFPETYIIDPQGTIRLRYDGSRDWSDELSMKAIELFLHK